MLSGIRPYLALTALCLALYLTGIAALPPLDRDEARFAQATKQMLETGDFVDIRFQDQPRHKKPAGIYWLQAVSVTLVSHPEKAEIWAYRVPSAAAAWLAVLMTFALGARLFDRGTALLGAGLLAGSLMLVLEAHQAKTDAVLLACIVAAQACLARLYLARPSAERDISAAPPGLAVALGFWAAQGLGILVKGPIAPFVALLTILTLAVADRDWRWLQGLRTAIGMPLALAIVAPWGLAVWGATGGAFYAEAVGTDLVPKLLGGQESHGAPPGYYALLMSVFFWPASLFAGPALVAAWRQRTAAAVRFCLAWLVPAWVAFELVPTKLPHYVLPLYPALALLTAAALSGSAAALKARWAPILYAVASLPGLVLAAAFVVAPFVLADGLVAWSPVAAAAAAGAAFAGFRLARRERFRPAAVTALMLGSVALATALSGVLPRLDGMWLSRELATTVAAVAPERDAPVAVSGFSEPSIVFLLGTATVLTDGEGAARHLLARPGAVAAVAASERDAFLRHLGRQGAVPEPLATVSGINYSKGKRLVLDLYRLGS